MTKSKVFVRSPYNYDGDSVSDLTGLSCPDKSLAQQQFRDETNINSIVRKFGVTGQVPGAPSLAQFGDFSGVHDYHSAMLQIMAAEAAFDALPATLRQRFDNDPQAFLDFVSNDENRSEAIELGLVPPPARPDGLIPSPTVAIPADEA
jgi:phage internal scaffolding protein